MKLTINKMNSKIFFQHVPKTGGTSVYTLLKKNFESLYITNLCDLEGVDSIDEYQLISGHLPFKPVAEKFPEFQFQVIVFMRNPVGRFISAFKLSRRINENPENFGKRMNMMRNMTMSDFLNTRQGFMEVHTPLFLLAKANGYRGLDVDTAFENAIKFLNNENVLVCLTERMDESLERINDKIKLKNLNKLQSLNTSQQNPYELNESEITEANEKLTNLLSTEQKLYDKALDLFENYA